MSRVVVLGALGMAGHVMSEYLDGRGYDVYGIARSKGPHVDKVLDVTDFNSLASYLHIIKPDIVINCVGMLVAACKKNISDSILVNSYLPHFISDVGDDVGYRTIHISTDCVFSGKDGCYREDSFPDGGDVYARTKSLGELNDKKNLTIRTSIVGPELKEDGVGLLGWFLKQRGEISGYTQAYWSGVTTLELAKATYQMLEQDVSGIYHLCPGSKISKYDLLNLFLLIWKVDLHIKPDDKYLVDKSLVCTRTDFRYNVPGYVDMLEELKQWMDIHGDYYTQYI